MTVALLGLVIVVVAASFVAGSVLAQRRAAQRVTALTARVRPDADRFAPLKLDQAFDRLDAALSVVEQSASSVDLARERLQAAFDALPIGIVVADERGVAVLRNETAEHVVGVRHADALVADAVSSLLAAAGSGEVARRTLQLFGPPRRTVVLTASPFGGSATSGALVTIEDVTERSRLEAMRTDFVANISHELKTPVGALALLAETLAGEDEPEVVERLADRMVIEAHRVSRVIEDLLELSRLEVGEQPLREVVGVGLLAAEAVERVRPLADFRTIEVRIEDPSRRLAVVGDRRQLVSALSNLVENGVKYSDAGSHVEVSAEQDGPWVDLVVTDHGMGIPARDLDRIFERFYRVDRARSRETGGTGLGLSIVRHVATNHGGSVAVTSTEGVGSVFRLRIPAGPGRLAVVVDEQMEAS